MTQPSNLAIVIAAALKLGADVQPVDVEDVAIEADALGPGRFRWRKHTQHINLQAVGKLLRDGKAAGLLQGTSAAGWMLTDAGVAAGREPSTRNPQAPQPARSRGDRTWLLRERRRLLTEDAFLKVVDRRAETITAREAQRFFHLDEYVVGDARRARIDRVLRAFADDPDLGPAMKVIEGRLPS